MALETAPNGNTYFQDVNLRRFRASMNPRFGGILGGILDFMKGLPDFVWKISIRFNVVHTNVHW